MSICLTAISPGRDKAMVTVEETARALEGVLRIAIFDPAGAGGFGRDVKSCARSFWAYAIALPATLLLLGIEVLGADSRHPLLYALSHLIGEVIEVAGFPLLLMPLIHWYGRGERWAWFVTGYNWLSMAQTIVFVAVLGLVWDFPGGEIRGVVLGAEQIYFLVLEAFLARAVLGIGAWRAALVVVLDFGFGIGVDRLAGWIGG
jgi:hypothetical protein